MLLANLSELGKNVLDIFWLVFLDINSCNSWSSLWVVIEGVVVSSSNSEELLWRVNVVAEVEVVDLINISSVHVSLEENIENIFRS